MESIESYLTKEGWKKDYKKTKRGFADLYKSSKLDNLILDEKGNAGIVFLAIAATPICAYVGSYIGEGMGWVAGNIIDFIPLARDVAPWLAERSGLINDAKTAVDLNENLYQTSGATGGFWSGLFLPLNIFLYYAKNKIH